MGVPIPLLGALIGLGSWWKAHAMNHETEQEAKLLEEVGEPRVDVGGHGSPAN